jgi:uncharacterized membrane protein YGL010W
MRLVHCRPERIEFIARTISTAKVMSPLPSIRFCNAAILAKMRKTSMRTLQQQLGRYAAYHGDGRNIATHFIGIPMIVFAVTLLLSRPTLEVAGCRLSPACLAVALSIAYYLRLDRGLAIVMALLFGLALWGADAVVRLGGADWLVWGLGLFLVGWLLQFVGHFFEGRKPAFLDDLAGLIIGPLFVVVEAGFLFGWGETLKSQIHLNAAASDS